MGLGNETEGTETDDAWEAGSGNGTEGRDDDDGADESRELSSISSGRHLSRQTSGAGVDPSQ